MRVYYDLLILIFTEINCYCCYCYCYKKLLNVCTDEAKRQQFCSHNGVLAALIMYSERSRENGEAVARREVINVRYRFIACDRPLGQSTVALTHPATNAQLSWCRIYYTAETEQSRTVRLWKLHYIDYDVESISFFTHADYVGRHR